jgi:hypothetical protein
MFGRVRLKGFGGSSRRRRNRTRLEVWRELDREFIKLSPGLTEVANATTATHLARSRGSRHHPPKFAHLLELRSPPAAPTRYTFVVIVARKRTCGKSRIVHGLHPRLLPEARGGHRIYRRPVRTAESTLPRSLGMISTRTTATHSRLTDQLCCEREPIRFSSIVQYQNSINGWWSSISSGSRP